jgi:PAS domain S-box-containing protein
MVRFIAVLSPRTRTLAPFGAAVLLALATIVLPPRPESWLGIGAAIVLSLVLVLAAFAVTWKSLPGWAPGTLPLLYFLVIALLREAQGGSASGYAPLCMLPVFWLALYGSRRQLALAIGAVAVIFVGPLLLGGSEYATSEWRRAILWVAIAGLVGFRVQALVADVKRRGQAGRMQAAALVEAEARMAEATRHSPIGIATAELDGTFLSVNPALCRMLGRAQESLLGRRGREFSHPDDLEGTAGALARLLSGSIPSLQEEKRYLRPDGTEVTALLSMTLVRDADGVPRQLLAHFADVTAQKQAEQALRESEASLQAIARVARELSSSTDVRSAVCQATLEVAGADSAFIMEPDGGELALRASAGPEWTPIRVSLGRAEDGPWNVARPCRISVRPEGAAARVIFVGAPRQREKRSSTSFARLNNLVRNYT